MRKSKSEAAETRRRIIDAAAAEFRRNGIDGTGLADIMAAAGLTHGGFYRHFASKDQLVAEACGEAMNAAVALTGAVPAEADHCTGLAAIIENFLSLDHRDNVLQGCPLVGLGSELARADPQTQAAASAGFAALVAAIARQCDSANPEAARARAIFALTAMVGALTLSRIVADPSLSAEILEETKRQLLE